MSQLSQGNAGSDESDSEDDVLDEESSVASLEMGLDQLGEGQAPNIEQGLQQTADYVAHKRRGLFK